MTAIDLGLFTLYTVEKTTSGLFVEAHNQFQL